ncbi:MAG: alpha/beta hydrolase [Myxococcota bacterium]
MPDPGTIARGATRLAFDAVEQLSRVVEGMHANIAALSPPLGAGTDGRTRGITGFVYGCIRTVNAGARAVLEDALGRLAADAGDAPASAQAETLTAILNGVLGDHLAATANPLAIPMRLRSVGELRTRVVLLIHGLCMHDRQWQRNGHDHGAALALELGMTAVYLHYNTGRHVSENGRELALQLEALLGRWPAPEPELTILAHSMGGLVARSARHFAAQAGHAWPARLARLVFLGTPHHGVPLERGGAWVNLLLGSSPYTSPLARLGWLRSAGITDLRYGNLRDEDWQGHDRFARAGDRRCITPLPDGVECHAIAAARDVLVPVASALGRHRDPDRSLAFAESDCWVGNGLSHLDLLDHAEVYARLRGIMSGAGRGG